MRVLIAGRPNVGKSTLFNRLTGRRRSLVHNVSGVTRDRIEREVEWDGRIVRFFDTGGLEGDLFAEEIESQVKVALEQTDVIVFLVDGRAGVLPDDHKIVRMLQEKQSRKIPIICAVNKCDTFELMDSVNEFYELGVDEYVGISAEHGLGTVQLKEQILTCGQDAEEIVRPDEDPNRLPRIAIVGKPNVGKSSLVNAFLGNKRMITSDIAGTTVDAIDSITEIDEIPFVLVDTAGVRRKSKTQKGVEVLSVVQTIKALDRADIAFLVVDGETGIADQDEKIGGLIEKAGCSVVIVVNKWDTQTKNREFSQKQAAERIRKQMRYLGYAPIVFTSALKKRGLKGLGELAQEIIQDRKKTIPTPEFTDWVRKEAEVHNPKNAKFYYCHQSGKFPPTFVCHVNDPKKVHFSLQRHLVNGIRARWSFMGSPIRMKFSERTSKFR